MSLFAYSINIIRTSGAFDENGFWKEAFSTNDTILGTIQPVSDQEYMNLPEGRKQYGAMKVYTTSSLKVCDPVASSAGDMFIFDGQKWEIAQKLVYASGLIPHNKYIAYLVVEPNV